MLAMKKGGGLSRLIFSGGNSGSEIPASVFSHPTNSISEEFDKYIADELVEENESFEAGSSRDGESLSLDPQEGNFEEPHASFTSKWCVDNVEESGFPIGGSRSTRYSSEAPARLQTKYEQGILAHELCQPEKLLSRSHNSSPAWDLQVRSEPMEIAKKGKHLVKVWKKLQKQRSWSTESSRNEAWERRRHLYLSEELKNMKDDGDSRALGRCISDCGERTQPRKQRFLTRTLTDDDLEELKGCIDLGFGFGSTEDPHLCNTLPALELCYALDRQLSSPSMSDGGLQNSSLYESPLSSPEGTWRISTPGDKPQQVKTRLRHWAQAVACSVRQSC
ncbi:hypothetical protein O6H91_06G102800 [Diphasiastrum complanatum]|uniref:Uncharacterized protein n=1 Tax=Diphasiastrum complanatum TaxID=34168 RepID=A0ACC2DGU6_DIPCM|nr:hypothetical protein O6H91_Y322200 [Diphasiastrum complanatum]KAJ7553543.1 hypothetical protein O6H91_06G102800 [Diphasiastrum complanatum]